MPPGTCESQADTESLLRAMQARGLWNGSFNSRESSLQQLAPFVGKLKTGIVHSLIEQYSSAGERVCDPFSGCGVVPLQALLMGRKAFANDLSPYAACVTKGKLSAPAQLEDALVRVEKLAQYVSRNWVDYDLRKITPWVRSFFHPRTLKETLAAFEFCRTRGEWFLAACLCGILHHQRPGFLSYPSSHMVPYLRTALFPKMKFPDLYGYRPLVDRLKRKVERAYRRHQISKRWSEDDYQISQRNARSLPYPEQSVELILTSPPYYDALDYARDNRLRLWFLGQKDWRELERRLTAGAGYESEMKRCLREMHRVLKVGRFCLLIVGEVQRNGKTRDTGAVLGKLATEVTGGGFKLEFVIDDPIPDIRRSRRGTQTTRVERILVLKKVR